MPLKNQFFRSDFNLQILRRLAFISNRSDYGIVYIIIDKLFPIMVMTLKDK